MKTFMDLYEYIQTAETDEIGFHNIGENKYFLHIHDNKKEVDVCVKLTDTHWSSNKSIGNFVFNLEKTLPMDNEEEGIVEMYSVVDGCCNHDEPKIHPISTPLRGIIPGNFGSLPILHSIWVSKILCGLFKEIE